MWSLMLTLPKIGRQVCSWNNTENRPVWAPGVLRPWFIWFRCHIYSVCFFLTSYASPLISFFLHYSLTFIIFMVGFPGGSVYSLVAKALNLQLAGCEFNTQPRRCRVTTLGKLFTPTCLSRSQWFSDGMIDCGVRGRGQLCLSRQPLRCTALGTGCAPFL